MCTICQQLDPNNHLDVAVFACLTTAFYASARVGEFTVHWLDGFNLEKSITQKNLTHGEDHNQLKVTTLHVPKTKTSNAGKDIFWAKQMGLMDLEAALQHHLVLNNPSNTQHLFAYCYKTGHQPLTKTKFIDWLAKATHNASLEPLQGHGICIGSTLEYLLRGMPFDVMKAKGCWASDTFLVYLRKHALIMAPYIQATPKVHEVFIRYTMPPVH